MSVTTFWFLRGNAWPFNFRATILILGVHLLGLIPFYSEAWKLLRWFIVDLKNENTEIDSISILITIKSLI